MVKQLKAIEYLKLKKHEATEYQCQPFYAKGRFDILQTDYFSNGITVLLQLHIQQENFY